ncbi:chemotaxis protein CheX [Desulfuromusa kysingii]|uniref:Chemotaxis protein CheX n=1 Tax=Desulfuromusa kysingii TaxID=37625 RepID=A0A1H4CQR5_9BACT|nr:chemotaxis protein CheX [Desulfuromusa kysingii]SEA62442.1 chemotaxis protein CheX [Desulfuromusa kysingii]
MEFAKKIVETTEEIFSTMIFMDIASEPPFEEGKQVLGCHVSAMIGLTGSFSGMLGIHCPENVGLAISGAMLDMEIDEINADVKDALGEIANMAAGGIKERFAAENIDLELAIPTAISGKSYTISSPTKSNRLIIPFRVEQGRFFIEMKYNLN